MTEDEQNAIAASVGAHEQAIAVLLALHLKGMTQEQRAYLKRLIAQPPQPIPGLTIPDVGMADDVAGLLIGYKDAMNRLFDAAIAIAERRP
jgi:hypothetical protein